MTTTGNGKIYELLSAIKSYLELKLPQLRSVEIFSGIFDEDEVKHFVTSNDMMRLAFLGAANIDGRVGGEAVLFASFAVYTVVSGQDALRVAVNRMEAVQAIMMQAGHADDDGLDVTGLLEVIPGEIQNLYSREVGARGVALLGASFVVPIVIGQAVFGRDIETYDPTKFYLDNLVGEHVLLDPNSPAVSDADD